VRLALYDGLPLSEHVFSSPGMLTAAVQTSPLLGTWLALGPSTVTGCLSQNSGEIPNTTDLIKIAVLFRFYLDVKLDGSEARA